MRLMTVELPAGGFAIEFETQKELISAESLKRRKMFEERIPRFLQTIQKGMDRYEKRLEDRRS